MQTTSTPSMQILELQLNDAQKALDLEAIECARKYKVAEAQLLDVILKVDTSKFFKRLGYDSTFAYCVERLKLSQALTFNFINVARKSKEVPQLKDAISLGEISVSTARKIVPILSKSNQEEWITKAKILKKKDLEEEVLRISPNKKRKLNLEIEIETGKMFDRAQELVRNSQKRPVAKEAVLDAVLKFYLFHKDPLEKSKRYFEKEYSRSLSQDSIPKSLKQTSRHLSVKVRHAVYNRDQGNCQGLKANGQKCRSTKWVEIHHIQSREFGGSDNLENLITLCHDCHRKAHRN